MSKCSQCDGSGKCRNPKGVIIIDCSVCEGSGEQSEINQEAVGPGQVSFYIDQNIISEMRDGEFEIPKHRVFDLVEQRRSFNSNDFLVLAYSSETIYEIIRSGSCESFMEVLSHKRARKLLEFSDLNNENALGIKCETNGKLNSVFHYVDPSIHFEFYKTIYNRSECRARDVIVFAGVVIKIAGFLGLDCACWNRLNLEESIDLNEILHVVREIREKVNSIRGPLSGFSKSSNPILDIWLEVLKKIVVNPEITDNIFFGLSDSGAMSADLIVPHITLNVLGYFNDKNQRIADKFEGFMSDIRHVNYAQRTDVFFSHDKNLTIRAAALYKWENNKTSRNMMTVFRRLGKRDLQAHCEESGETIDQASDRSMCIYTDGCLMSLKG